MSQTSSVSSHEEAESGESDHTTTSHSRCNSSSSILTAAVWTEPNKEVSTSLETGWTDSKHSSYLDFMEATFVMNMYGSSYCAEDVCGKSSCHHHQNVDIEEEFDNDSAESQLHIPFETMEFKSFERGDWTRRPASRSMAPVGIPRVLLTNPWVQHFRPKNASSILSKEVSSRKDGVRSMVLSSPKPVTRSVEHHLQRVNIHELTSSSNPVDAGVSKTKKRALWSTDNQVPVSRQKIDNENGGRIETNKQENESPPDELV